MTATDISQQRDAAEDLRDSLITQLERLGYHMETLHEQDPFDVAQHPVRVDRRARVIVLAQEADTSYTSLITLVRTLGHIAGADGGRRAPRQGMSKGDHLRAVMTPYQWATVAMMLYVAANRYTQHCIEATKYADGIAGDQPESTSDVAAKEAREAADMHRRQPTEARRYAAQINNCLIGD